RPTAGLLGGKTAVGRKIYSVASALGVRRAERVRWVSAGHRMQGSGLPRRPCLLEVLRRERCLDRLHGEVGAGTFTQRYRNPEGVADGGRGAEEECGIGGVAAPLGHCRQCFQDARGTPTVAELLMFGEALVEQVDRSLVAVLQHRDHTELVQCPRDALAVAES